jgi:hypothetical protein
MDIGHGARTSEARCTFSLARTERTALAIVDFGKNTYQCAISFKFECLGANLMASLVENLLIRQKLFSEIVQAQPANQVSLVRGAGTEANPYFQCKISRNEILLWAGWGVSFEAWQAWREQLLDQITAFLKDMPVEFTLAITSQVATGIPIEKYKELEDVAELQPVFAIYNRFVPKEMMARANAHIAFGDQDGKQTVTWWNVAPAGGHEAITFMVRLNALDYGATLRVNATVHTKSADELAEKFHSNFLALLLSR